MAGISRKNQKGERITHFDMLKDEDVNRWYENIKAGSGLTAGVYLRGLGFYCAEMKTTPNRILEDAKEIKPLQDQFMDFVRMMEKRGKKGTYISRYKKVLHSWTKHNGLEFRTIAKIRNENISELTQNETVPSQDELGKILRHAGLRAKVEISLMAFSGLRPRSISNDIGSDCLKISDISELRIEDGKIAFEKEPIRINVRSTLNKGEKHGYTTFIGPEGVTYLKEYLEYRISENEELTSESPVLQYDRNVTRQHDYIPTFYIEREIREAIIDAGFFRLKKNSKGNDIKSPTKRPYVLRAYFATGMDISEQKGFVSHPWRQYWMGHKGDMEARYSTNKKLRDTEIEEMRGAYSKCLAYLETQQKLVSPEEKQLSEKIVTGLVLKKVFGFSDEEIADLIELDDKDLQKKLDEKRKSQMNNGHSQKVIPMREVKHYIEELGWEYVRDLGSEAIVRIPEH